MLTREPCGKTILKGGETGLLDVLALGSNFLSTSDYSFPRFSTSFTLNIGDRGMVS